MAVLPTLLAAARSGFNPARRRAAAAASGRVTARLGRSGCVFRQSWPCFDPGLVKEEEVEIPVQVNGKLRGHIRIPFGASKELVEQRALSNEKVQPFVAGKQILKIIIIPDKLVNIVVKG